MGIEKINKIIYTIAVQKIQMKFLELKGKREQLLFSR